LGGSGALSGTASVTFAQTASLLGFGALNGTATATFGQSGNLSSTGALSGSATLVFSQSGDLTGGPMAGSISGTATLVFGQSGLLAGFGDMAGTGAIIFGQTGTLADANAVTVQNRGDDGFHRGIRPIAQIRPKAERDLDDVLELVEALDPDLRVKDNAKTVKAALAVARKINVADIYAPALASINKALVNVSRATTKHHGLAEKAAAIAVEIDTLVSAMEARRKRQKHEEEEILWLLSTTNNLSMQPA
jgi:hypothetical protein